MIIRGRIEFGKGLGDEISSEHDEFICVTSQLPIININPDFNGVSKLPITEFSQVYTTLHDYI